MRLLHWYDEPCIVLDSLQDAVTSGARTALLFIAADTD